MQYFEFGYELDEKKKNKCTNNNTIRICTMYIHILLYDTIQVIW